MNLLAPSTGVMLSTLGVFLRAFAFVRTVNVDATARRVAPDNR